MRFLSGINRILASGPVALLICGYLGYHFVADDGWPWWLPVLLFTGAFVWGAVDAKRSRR